MHCLISLDHCLKVGLVAIVDQRFLDGFVKLPFTCRLGFVDELALERLR